MEQQFSIGEYVVRRFDGKVGVVRRVQPGVGDHEGDFYFYVDLDPHRPSEDNVWAGTTAAWERRSNLHAHVGERSRDCDGDYSSGRVEEMTLEERCDQFGDLHFKERVLGNAVSLHGYGDLKVTPEGIEWYERTEEGYSAVDATWCENECPSERSWQRDHRAEAAGY